MASSAIPEFRLDFQTGANSDVPTGQCGCRGKETRAEAHTVKPRSENDARKSTKATRRRWPLRFSIGGRYKDRTCDPYHVKVAEDQAKQDLTRSPSITRITVQSGVAQGVGVSAGSVRLGHRFHLTLQRRLAPDTCRIGPDSRCSCKVILDDWRGCRQSTSASGSV